MVPRSSIKRLRFAFVAMAGLTLLAFVVGYITFSYSHVTQKKFLVDTTPLLINVEQLSKTAIWFASTSRQLETIDTLARLNRVLASHRSQSDRLQQGLLNLAKVGPDKDTVGNLKNTVQRLEAVEVPYAETLRAKINATTRLEVLQRQIGEQGQTLQDLLVPYSLEASLDLMALTKEVSGDIKRVPEVLDDALNEVQLLTDISFAAERFLQAVDKINVDATANQTIMSKEALAPEFRRLTQLVLKLRDENARHALAGSLHLFNQKALESGGIIDQWQRRRDAITRLDILNQQKIVLLTRMTDLVDRVVIHARKRFFNDAEFAKNSSFMAVSALAVLTTVAFFAVLWIGWRLINRDIAQRLERLAQSTVALADGDLDITIDQSGRDELADMARATEIFRRNALELRRAEADLADRLVDVEQANQKLLSMNAALDMVNADLAESELRYDLALRGSSSGIWDWNARTNVLFWSDRMKQIVGVAEQAFKPEISSFSDRLHPDDYDRVMKRRRLHLEHRSDYDVECRLRREDGSYVWVQNSGQAVWDEEGNVVRMAGSAEDITDRKNAEIKLTRYAQELERSNRELDDFAYIASHDLKEPLRAMYNHATFLLEDFQEKLGEEGQKRLRRMIKLGKRMEKLIADLLYFSRLGRGDQTMEVIDLNGVILDIEANLAEALTSRNARISVPEHLPLINGHPAHITALFQNLISNGIKYNKSQEKIVEIGLMPHAPAERAIGLETFYVRDNGIGIEEQFQHDVFRIFKRLNSEKAFGEGTGAGLTFAKKIVDNHGGQIWIKSESGEGTTFFLTLPQGAASAGEVRSHVA